MLILGLVWREGLDPSDAGSKNQDRTDRSARWWDQGKGQTACSVCRFCRVEASIAFGKKACLEKACKMHTCRLFPRNICKKRRPGCHLLLCTGPGLIRISTTPVTNLGQVQRPALPSGSQQLILVRLFRQLVILPRPIEQTPRAGLKLMATIASCF